MPGSPSGELSRLLVEAVGDDEAKKELFGHVYAELRRMAQRRMDRERPDHTWEATALVHEVYFRLMTGAQVFARGRSYFFAAAARAMQQLLREHARRPALARRERSVLDDVVAALERTHGLDILDLTEAIEKLRTIGKNGERRYEVVRLRFFGGLSWEEIAAVLEVSVATVERDWQTARAWLYRQLRGGDENG